MTSRSPRRVEIDEGRDVLTNLRFSASGTGKVHGERADESCMDGGMSHDGSAGPWFERMTGGTSKNTHNDECFTPVSDCIVVTVHANFSNDWQRKATKYADTNNKFFSDSRHGLSNSA